MTTASQENLLLHTVVDITLLPTGLVVPENVVVIEFCLIVTNPEPIDQLPWYIFVDIQTIARTAGTPKTILKTRLIGIDSHIGTTPNVSTSNIIL